MYIQSFSQIVKPLFELSQKDPLQGKDIVKKRKVKNGSKNQVVIPSKSPFRRYITRDFTSSNHFELGENKRFFSVMEM